MEAGLSDFELDEYPDMEEIVNSLEAIYGKTEEGLKEAFKDMYKEKPVIIENWEKWVG